jgi:hypothetical protein
MRGKLLILLILSIALSAAGFAWWWNYQRAARARQFWGPSAATIRFATQVEAFQIDLPEEPSEPDELLRYAGPMTDITGAPGLLNAATSLMSDDGFDWSTDPFTPPPSDEWYLGVRFSRESESLTLQFSKRSNAMLIAERGQAVMLSPKTAAGWKSYLARALQISPP